MTFAEALEYLRAGGTIRGDSWSPGLSLQVRQDVLLLAFPDGSEAEFSPSQAEAGQQSWSIFPGSGVPQHRTETSPGSFGWAMDALEEGHLVTREGWLHRHQFITQAEAVDCGAGVELEYLWLLSRATGVEVWHITGADALALDWQLCP